MEKTYQEDNEIEFFSHLCGSPQKLSKYLLAFGKLTTANEVGSVEGHDTVDDEQTVFVSSEVCSKAFQQFELHLEN